jgi:hypothetical protein
MPSKEAKRNVIEPEFKGIACHGSPLSVQGNRFDELEMSSLWLLWHQRAGHKADVQRGSDAVPLVISFTAAPRDTRRLRYRGQSAKACLEVMEDIRDRRLSSRT